MKIYTDIFEKIVCLENLFLSWDKFKKDKAKKKDVLAYEWNLEENIIQLHRDLKYHRYKHGVYTPFDLYDPKPRKVHKATVRDRILHHAVFRILNPIFEPTFISHSFSCRIGKGTHKGVNSLTNILIKTSQNHHRVCFALKCDIRKFFASIDHEILLSIIKKRIKDKKTIGLVGEIIYSFSFGKNNTRERERERERESRRHSGIGLPIGNLTSQLFANIYLNEFDYFIKHNLRIKYYLRYTDDFIITSQKKEILEGLVPKIQDYLKSNLNLGLHQDKIIIRKFRQGIDFLGYIIFPHRRLLRAKTKKRVFQKLKKRAQEYRRGLISEETLTQSLNSYLGVLSHADTHRLQKNLKNQL